jgi:hypothetical protein
VIEELRPRLKPWTVRHPAARPVPVPTTIAFHAPSRDAVPERCGADLGKVPAGALRAPLDRPVEVVLPARGNPVVADGRAQLAGAFGG